MKEECRMTGRKGTAEYTEYAGGEGGRREGRRAEDGNQRTDYRGRRTEDGKQKDYE
jgi:hypothetical protein